MNADLRKIVEGGPFDVVEAIRQLAISVVFLEDQVVNTQDKGLDSAQMDQPDHSLVGKQVRVIPYEPSSRPASLLDEGQPRKPAKVK